MVSQGFKQIVRVPDWDNSLFEALDRPDGHWYIVASQWVRKSGASDKELETANVFAFLNPLWGDAIANPNTRVEYDVTGQFALFDSAKGMIFSNAECPISAFHVLHRCWCCGENLSD